MAPRCRPRREARPMSNGEIELDLPTSDGEDGADLQPNPARDVRELAAVGLVLLAASAVVTSLIQALALTQVREGEAQVPWTFTLQVAATGASVESVAALAAAVGLVVVGTRGAIARMGRVVLAVATIL